MNLKEVNQRKVSNFMTKKIKQTYYAVICPVCKWKTVGDWKAMQIVDYKEHFVIEHYKAPIIKSEKR